MIKFAEQRSHSSQRCLTFLPRQSAGNIVALSVLAGAAGSVQAAGFGSQDYWAEDMHYKPKWMRWHTFNRLCARLDHYEEMLNDHTLRLLARLMAMAPR